MNGKTQNTMTSTQKKGRETPAKTKIDRYRWSHPKSKQNISY